MASRLYPTRRAVEVVAVLVAVVGLIFVISPVPMPWRLAALGPALLFSPVVGAASIMNAERDRANQRLRHNQHHHGRAVLILFRCSPSTPAGYRSPPGSRVALLIIDRRGVPCQVVPAVIDPDVCLGCCEPQDVRIIADEHIIHHDPV